MTTDVADMELQEKIDLIRSSLTPLDLADMFELPVTRDKITSPFNPTERTPSCHLFLDGWFDYSTGKHGDVIDLYRALSGAGLGRAVNRLLEGAQRMDADPDRVVRKPVELPDLTEQWRADLAENFGQGQGIAEWWAFRLPGVEATLIRRMAAGGWLGMELERLQIPHWHDGIVRGIKLRYTKGMKSAVPGSTFACGLYRPVEPAGHSTAIITEGESDCWSMMTHVDGGQTTPADVYALPAGAGLWKDAWLEQLTGYDTIYTAFDNDRAGRQATEKVRKAIGWGRWKELMVPQLYNDVRAAMAAGWAPRLGQS